MTHLLFDRARASGIVFVRVGSGPESRLLLAGMGTSRRGVSLGHLRVEEWTMKLSAPCMPRGVRPALSSRQPFLLLWWILIVVIICFS